jgi:hypothetical protein
MATLRPNWPAGLPSPEALQTATDALRRYFVLPETMLHPVVAGQATELAYLLMAYGLAVKESNLAAAQSGMIANTARKSPRGTGTFDEPRRAGQHVWAVHAAADAMELGTP